VNRKLVPSSESADGCAFTVPELVIIVIDWTLDPKEPMGPVTLPMVARFVELMLV
jgi:hypothetical protein